MSKQDSFMCSQRKTKFEKSMAFNKQTQYTPNLYLTSQTIFNLSNCKLTQDGRNHQGNLALLLQALQDLSTFQAMQLKHGDSDDDSDSNQQYFSCNSPFTEFYSKEQLVYQRYDNAKFNKFKDVPYYPGSFLPKNLFFDYMKGTP